MVAIKILATDKKLYAFSFMGEVSYIAEENKILPKAQRTSELRAFVKLKPEANSTFSSMYRVFLDALASLDFKL